MLTLGAGGYRLKIDPERGGSIVRFDWRERPVLRPPLFDVASFPLIPFSNRIAHGRFVYDGREVRLAPTFPGGDIRTRSMAGRGRPSPRRQRAVRQLVMNSAGIPSRVSSTRKRCTVFASSLPR